MGNLIKYNLKEMVSDNKKAKFLFFKLNELWYETETGFKFPVPTNVEEVGDATFHAEEKALMLMRYIRKHIAYLEQAEKDGCALVRGCGESHTP